MSSTEYSAELRPDPRMRVLVLASGTSFAALGLVMLALIDANSFPRAILGLAWLVHTGRALWCTVIAYTRNGILRVSAGGETAVRTGSDAWEPAQLCSGSIVLPQLAWLRITAANGTRYAELLHGCRRKSEDWRRFQVIWRHIGAHQ